MEKQHKSTCLSCGKEWYYTRKDLSQSKLNRSRNEIKKTLINTTSVLGKKKLSATINAISDLPEVAHQCPACGSKNVTLEVIKDDTQKEQDTKLIKFIIICAVIVISIITISICATVIIFKINSPNTNAQKTIAETTITTTSPTIIPLQTPTPTVEPQTEITIIGSDKESVRKLLNAYKEKTSIMGENAIDFDSDNLLVTVFFNNEKADGVIFLSNNLDSMNTTTGEGSYVSKHYDELVKMATNDTNIKIESDLTKFNSQGKKKVASELYIGNTPYNDTTNTTTQNTPTPETKVNTSSDSEFESLVFLNVGVKVYRYKDENSYLGTIKMVDRDYKDESGKKVGAVYLEGGEVEGWYHRRDLVSNCYIRSDDPHKMGY